MSSSHIKKLIVDYIHRENKHAGVQLTLNILRLEFWILNDRNLVHLIIQQCVACIRIAAKTSMQYISSLPADRSNLFSALGVDCAGPFFIHDKLKRGSEPH